MNQITPSPAVPPQAGAARADGRSLRWDDHRESRHGELVMAARRAIHRHGPGASMEDIANEAGTSKSVYYRYFGDKDGLRRAIGADVIDRLGTAMLEADADAGDPVAGLRAMIHTYLAQAAASPNTYAFVVAPSATGDDEVAGFAAVLSELMAKRLPLLGAGQPDPGLWAAAALGLLRAGGERWLVTDAAARPDVATFTDLLTGWLLNGAGFTHHSSTNQEGLHA